MLLTTILFVGFGYSLAEDQGKDFCVSIPFSTLDRNLVFSSTGILENRVYLNLTSSQEAVVTACTGPVRPALTKTSKVPPNSLLPAAAVTETGEFSEPLEPNYYWRTYNGTIPSDAVPVGNDEAGRTSYCGSAYFSFGTVAPGEIRQGDKHVYTHLDKKLYATAIAAKILCAPPSQQPKWFKFDVENQDILTKCMFIKEGNFRDSEFHLARAYYNGRYVFGKPYPRRRIYEGIEIWVNKMVFFPTGFELLGYC